METPNCDRCTCLIVESEVYEGPPGRFFARYGGRGAPPRHAFSCSHFCPPWYISDMPPIQCPDWCPNIVRNKP